MKRLVLALCLLAATAFAQSKRILYVTHSAGFKHGSIPHSVDVLKELAASSGKLEIVNTEDVSQLTAMNLRNFDAVIFYTSGELPISDQQKSDLAEFIRSGKGFGGVHSATDTFYQWPEYANIIGGWFDGHPWTQEVRIKVNEASNPIVSHLMRGFTIRDEIYQIRNFAQGKANVLLSLDTSSVDLNAPGVHSSEFPLVWTLPYGQGRVFYSAFGHFDDVWDNVGIRRMLLNGMLWITGQSIEPDRSRRRSR